MEQCVHYRRQRPDRWRSQGAKRALGAGWFLRGKRGEVRPHRLQGGTLVTVAARGLVETGLPAILIETRHVKAALKAMTVKTDRNDARWMAQLMRMGWFR
jgi:transposase